MRTTSRASRRTARPTLDDEDPGQDRRPKRKRSTLSTVVCLSIGAALIWFAPAIIAHTPVVSRLVQKAVGEINGTISVGQASLGWLSPIVIRDIQVHDTAGKPLATIPTFTSAKSLLSLLFSRHELGSFELDKPEFDVVISEHGSNFEEAFAPLLAKKEPAQDVGLDLTLTGGTARIDDTVAGQQWQVNELACNVSVPHADDDPLELSATGHVSPAKPTGRFAVRLKVQPAAAAPHVAAADAKAPASAAAQQAAVRRWLDGSGDLSVVAEALPLEIFEPLARRFAGADELGGVLNASFLGEWRPDDKQKPHAELSGQAMITNLVIVAPWLEDDRLHLASLHVPLNAAREGERFELRQCDVQSDVGQFSCTGTIADLGRVEASWFASLASVLPHTQGEIKGDLDLAKLARLLPSTMRVREGLQINEGAVNVDLTAGPQQGNWACTGRLETTRLVATQEGRQIVWEHPLLVTLAGRDTEKGPTIERLAGEADFLRFEGTGTPDYFTLSGSFELARLAEDLGRFFDLGELQLAGDGKTYVTWKREANGTFAADAEFDTTNFVLARPGKPAWRDQHLQMRAGATGRMNGQDLERIETAQLRIDSAADEFTLSIPAPIADPNADKPWPIDAQLRGELGRWVARVEPWLGLPPGVDITGDAEVVATIQWSSSSTELEKCQADFQKLHAHGGGWFIDEPRARLTATGSWTPATQRLVLKEAALTAADVSAEIEDASLVMRDVPNGERIGRAKLQGNLATFERWTQNPRLPANWHLSGLVACTLHANLSDAAPAFDLDATIDDLVAVPREGQGWREHQVRLTVNSSYDQAADSVQLSRCKFVSDAVQLDASGRIDHWSKDRELAIAGTTNYDLEKVSLYLQPYVAGEVQAHGRESRQFALSGPLVLPASSAVDAVAAAGMAAPGAANPALENEGWQWARRLTGKADFGWQSASLYGFDLGPGSLQAELGGGLLTVPPTKFDMSGGTLALAPTKIRLAPGPVELELPPGPVVQQVEITPQMCQHWIKYVAPAFAGVTEAQGRFSVNLDGCTVPLANPQAGDAAGQMTVHSVEIGPGPLLQELAVLLDRPTGAKLTKESKVEFRMVQGRVYHRGLELEFPELTIRTHGSVGFDQTLAIMAEMPVPPKWIRDQTVGAVLKDQVIQIPIAGTLHKPQLDRNAMAQVMAQFVRKAAGGMLRNELGRQLDRLIPQPQPQAPPQP